MKIVTVKARICDACGRKREKKKWLFGGWDGFRDGTFVQKARSRKKPPLLMFLDLKKEGIGTVAKTGGARRSEAGPR